MNDQTNINFLQLALDLAAKGLPVFPCKPQDKRPYTDHGFKDASTDPAKVAAFWAQHPRALIGIPTGRASNLFALDLDTDDDTGEALGEAWLARQGMADLLTGPGAITPSGGRHVYFRADGLADGMRCTTAKALGVDTRGDGGYIIAPGSIAATGAYRATNGGLCPQPARPACGAARGPAGDQGPAPGGNSFADRHRLFARRHNPRRSGRGARGAAPYPT